MVSKPKKVAFKRTSRETERPWWRSKAEEYLELFGQRDEQEKRLRRILSELNSYVEGRNLSDATDILPTLQEAFEISQNLKEGVLKDAVEELIEAANLQRQLELEELERPHERFERSSMVSKPVYQLLKVADYILKTSGEPALNLPQISELSEEEGPPTVETVTELWEEEEPEPEGGWPWGSEQAWWSSKAEPDAWINWYVKAWGDGRRTQGPWAEPDQRPYKDKKNDELLEMGMKGIEDYDDDLVWGILYELHQRKSTRALAAEKMLKDEINNYDAWPHVGSRKLKPEEKEPAFKANPAVKGEWGEGPERDILLASNVQNLLKMADYIKKTHRIERFSKSFLGHAR